MTFAESAVPLLEMGSPNMTISRRRFVGTSLAGGLLFAGGQRFWRETALSAGLSKSPTPSRRDKVHGLLIGAMIGDAAGGPIEFAEPKRWQELSLPFHIWDKDETLNADRIRDQADAFRIIGYEKIRPQPASYGPWTDKAPAGTVTDDTRHKIILMDSLRKADTQDAWPMTVEDFARASIAYGQRIAVDQRPGYRKLGAEWLAEHNSAAQWVLGQRNPAIARPPQRLWGGIATVSGQMSLLPLAAIFPGRPEEAYRAAYALSFMDNGPGKDINAAIVAGLAAALAVCDAKSDPRGAFGTVESAMRDTDPHAYGKVPWVGRGVNQWLDFADDAAARADHSPRRLFDIFEAELKAHTWWEAHVPLATTFAVLRLCNYDPLASLQTLLEFGHDTDSYAQLLGSLVGSMYGAECFPSQMRTLVADRLEADYDERVDEWVELLLKLGDRKGDPPIIKFD